MAPNSSEHRNVGRGLHDLLAALHSFLGERYQFFARLSFAAFCVLSVIWMVGVVIRVVILSRIASGFGVDILMALPVSPQTASVISSVIATVALFSIDVVLSFVLFGRHKTQWRYTTIAVGLIAIGASVFLNREVLAGRCYVITPDRGPVLSYADREGNCGVDPVTGLQRRTVTPDIVLSLRALNAGITPSEVDAAGLDPNALFSAKDGHSLVWFSREAADTFRLFGGAGFDPRTQTPLEPVTPENASEIRSYIQGRIALRVEEQRKAQQAAQEEQVRAEAARRQEQAEAEAAAKRAQEESEAAAKRAQQEAQQRAEAKAAAECIAHNTGHFGFTNTKTVTRFTVVVYFREGSYTNRTIIVPPGQTEYIYDFPVGGHNYEITYRAMVPFMDFPPGAPLIEKDVVYMKGQIYVDQCKSKTLEIK